MIKINPSFNIGDLVYLKTDIYQKPRIITDILIRPKGLLLYKSSINGIEDYCYDFEITHTKNVVLATSN